MKIIKNYWSDKAEEIKSENDFLTHIQSQPITKVFIGFKEIKNFKIEIIDGRMILRYSLKKAFNLKYYCNLLSTS
jgi:hypothetical protein